MKITLANSGSFDDTYYSEPLTSYAVDFYKNFRIEEYLQFVAGSVIAPHRFQYRVWGSKDDIKPMTVAINPIRALGANFSAIPVTGTLQLAQTDNKGFSVILDDDEIDADPKWETMAVRKALRTLMEYDRQLLYFSVYDAVTPTSVTWNGGSGQDPDTDIITALDTVQYNSGVRPNRLVFTPSSWAARLKTLRAQSGFAASASAMQSPQELGDMLGLKVLILDAGAVAYGAQNTVTFVYQSDDSGADDVSSVKRFQSLCKDGQLFRAYKRMIGNKTWEVTTEHYNMFKVTFPESAGVLAVTTT